MGVDIGFAGAFLGGIATILAPCSAMLLPAFFAYAFTSRGVLIGRTLLFYLGLITTLVPLGVAAGSLGQWLIDERSLVVTVSAVIVIVLGALYALGIQIPLPGRTSTGGRDASSPVAVYALGLTYGVAGTCSGPILGSILAVASFGGDAARGGLLLAVYAAGMLVPVVILALLWDVADLGSRSWLRPRPVQIGPFSTTVVGLVAGLLLVGIGVLLLVTEGTASMGGVLDPARQIELEAWLRDQGRRFTDRTVLAVLILAVSVVAALWVWVAQRRTAQREAQPAAGATAQRDTAARDQGSRSEQ